MTPLEQQTAKMAEGPDPGQTLVKCEFSISSAFDKYKEKMSLEHLVSSTVCTIRCNQVISPLTPPAPPTLKELSNALDAVVDWHSLGVKLGLEGHELSAIDKTFRGDIARCKHEMLICCSRSGKLPTWKAIIDALHLMGQHTVASKIQARHCSSSTATGMCLLV